MIAGTVAAASIRAQSCVVNVLSVEGTEPRGNRAGLRLRHSRPAQLVSRPGSSLNKCCHVLYQGTASTARRDMLAGPSDLLLMRPLGPEVRFFSSVGGFWPLRCSVFS